MSSRKNTSVFDQTQHKLSEGRRIKSVGLTRFSGLRGGAVQTQRQRRQRRRHQQRRGRRARRQHQRAQHVEEHRLPLALRAAVQALAGQQRCGRSAVSRAAAGAPGHRSQVTHPAPAPARCRRCAAARRAARGRRCRGACGTRSRWRSTRGRRPTGCRSRGRCGSRCRPG